MSKRRRKQQRTSPAAPVHTGRLPFALLASGLLAATALVFAPIVQFDFVTWDDGPYVFGNPRVLSGLSLRTIAWAFTSNTPYWHPLTWISHMADVTLFGPGPHAMHAVNLAIHLANVLLLFVLLRGLTSRLVPPAFVAALFALHPLHVESVAWIAERKDLLSTLFVLVSLIAYAGYARRPGAIRYAGVAAAFVLSLMCKPMYVTLPALLLLLDYWPLGRVAGGASPARLCLEKAPLALLSAASMIVTYIGQQRTGTMSQFAALPLDARAANAVVSYAVYLRKMVWPVDLAAFYPYPAERPAAVVIASVLVLAAISAAALGLRRRTPYVIVGWLWYLLSLLPVIGFIQVGNQAMADRFTYLPLVGIFIAIAWLAADAVRQPAGRALAGAAAIAVLAGCAALTRAQIATWSDGAAMWTRVLEISPDSADAHSALGAELADRGQLQAARAHQEEALRLRPSDPDAHNELGKLDAERGDRQSAIRHFSSAVQYRPAFGEAWHNLGTALLRSGRPADAVEPLRRATELLPEDAGSRLRLAEALAAAGRTGEAIEQLESGLRAAPDDPMFLDLLTRLRAGR